MTAGRYYFAPLGTPHYPDVHNLGSRRWNDGNWGHVQALGEDLESPQPWNRGNPPVKLPLPLRVGGAACIRDGALIRDSIPIPNLFDGFNPACFQPRTIDIIAETSSIARCSLQRLYAAIIYYEYADDEAQIRAIFAAWLGDALTVSYTKATDSLPTVVVAYSESICLVILDGTRNYQVYAWQAFQLIVAPSDYGAFGTLPFWYNSSSYVNTILDGLGITPAVPLCLVGHSYGGAVAQILAARYKVENATRVVRCLTYGSPKPGDARMRTLLEECETINLANDDDFTPVAPPDYPTLLPVFTFLGVASLLAWNRWDKPPNVTLQTRDGILLPDNYPTFDFPTLLEFTGRALANVPQSPVAGHPILEYYRRASLRCPEVQWPINQGSNNLINIATQNLEVKGLTSKRGRLHLGGISTLKPIPAAGALQLDQVGGNVPTSAKGNLGLFGHQPYEPARADGLLALGKFAPVPAAAAAGRIDLVGGFVAPAPPAEGLIGLNGESFLPPFPAHGALQLGGSSAGGSSAAAGALQLGGSSAGGSSAAAGALQLGGQTFPPTAYAAGALDLVGSSTLNPGAANGKLELFGGGGKLPIAIVGKLGLVGKPFALLPKSLAVVFTRPIAAEKGIVNCRGYSIDEQRLELWLGNVPDDPGRTCDDAITPVSGTAIDWTNPTVDVRWYRITVPGFQTLTITPTLLSGDQVTLNVYIGSSCASKTSAGSFTFDGLGHGFFDFSTRDMFVEFSAPGGTAGSYRILFVIT